MPAITVRDTTVGADAHSYNLTRVVEAGRHVVRAHVARDFHAHQSFAVAEVLADNMTWTRLLDNPAGNWWTDTAAPSTELDAAAELDALTDSLIRRAVAILAPPPGRPAHTVTATGEPVALAPHVLDAIGALLLMVTDGYDSEACFQAHQIEQARARRGRLHIIDHGDGSVTVTKSHRDDCPFITSNGTQECDDDCEIYF